MSKLLFLLCTVAALTLSSCNRNKTGNSDKEQKNELQTEEQIKVCVTKIYDYAFRAEKNMEDIDKEFFTPDFYTLQEAVLEKQRKDQAPYIDHDHWVMGQDCHNPSYEIVKVEDIQAKSAKVYINVKAFDDQITPTLVRLTLELIGNEWKIKDIEEEYEGVFHSHKSYYNEVLAN